MWFQWNIFFRCSFIYIIYIMIFLNVQYINPVIWPHNGDLFTHFGVLFLGMTYAYPRSNEWWAWNRPKASCRMLCECNMSDPLNILSRNQVRHPFPGPIRPISLLFSSSISFIGMIVSKLQRYRYWYTKADFSMTSFTLLCCCFVFLNKHLTYFIVSLIIYIC